MKVNKVSEEESTSMGKMFNYMANMSVTPLLAKASVSMYPIINDDGEDEIEYKVELLQDASRSVEFPMPDKRYVVATGRGRTLEAAMCEISLHIHLLK